MRNTMPLLLFAIVAPFVAACQSNTSQNPDQSPATHNAVADIGERPIAFLNGKPVTQSELYRLIAPAQGGEALAEILLSRAVSNRLNEQGIQLDQADLDRERDQLLTSLDPDPDQAARLLKEMRDQRGLSNKRFDDMLRRNAGLRRLVRDQIMISDAAISQAYELRHGKRYQVRLIVTDKLDKLTKARRQVINGESFTDLAIELSSDDSARQGGLLSPISPVDPTYPKAIRDALPRLTMHNTATRLSPAIALDSGYALLYLEEVLSQDNRPTKDQVRAILEIVVRSELERLRMRQLARTLIEQADVVVLDPLLGKAWDRQMDSIESP